MAFSYSESTKIMTKLIMFSFYFVRDISRKKKHIYSDK